MVSMDKSLHFTGDRQGVVRQWAIHKQVNKITSGSIAFYDEDRAGQSGTVNGCWGRALPRPGGQHGADTCGS